MEELVKEIKLRKVFYAGFSSLVFLFLPEYILAITLLFAYLDKISEATWRQSLFIVNFTAYFLLRVILFCLDATDSESLWSLSLTFYVISLCVFHLGEFFVQSYYHPPTAEFTTFLIDHSKEYTFAIVASFLEHLLKLIIPYPSLKIIFFSGVFLTLTGHFFRIGSEINCGKNFTHKIKYNKTSDHTLVTNGFYRFCRHPSYFGWFMWSVGSQVMLGNFICAYGFYKTSSAFFRRRITEEEYLLRRFFGVKYIEFMSRTAQFFPFWHGFLMNDQEED